MKYFPLTFLFLILSCTEEDSELLIENKTVSSVFTESECEELQSLLDNFTEKLCASERKEISEPAECFNSYLQNINQTSPSSGIVPLPIAFEEQEELLSQISEQTFEQIWHKNTNAYGTFLDINIQGKYIEFLKLVSKEKTATAEYTESILEAGTIGVSAQANVILFPEKFDLSDVRIRLLLTVHFITISYNNRE